MGKIKSGRRRAFRLAGTAQQSRMTIFHHGSPLYDRLTAGCLARFVKWCVSATGMRAAFSTGDWLAIARVLAVHQHVVHARDFRDDPHDAKRRSREKLTTARFSRPGPEQGPCCYYAGVRVENSHEHSSMRMGGTLQRVHSGRRNSAG